VSICALVERAKTLEMRPIAWLKWIVVRHYKARLAEVAAYATGCLNVLGCSFGWPTMDIRLRRGTSRPTWIMFVA